MDNRTFAIGTLSVTAVILLAALAIMARLPGPQPALGSGQVMAGGDYIILSGQLQQSTELVYVIDTAVNSLNVYGYDPNRGAGLGIVQTVDLKKLLPGPPKKRTRRH